MSKIFKPNHNLIVPRAYNRRGFIQQVGRGGLGAIIAAGVMPQLFLNPAYAGTAVIMTSDTDKRVELSNASFARPFSLGTWSSMRIAIRVMMEGASSLTSLTPRLVIGLCNGSANQVFDATTPNFVGIRTTDVTWTYSAATIDRWSVDTGTAVATKRVTSTWTDGGQMNPAHPWYFFRASETAGNSAGYILEITKGSPNYSLASMFKGTTSDPTMTAAELLTNAVAAAPSPSGYVWDDANTIATDESAGTFDHVCIGWDRSEATIQISDIALVKMAA